MTSDEPGIGISVRLNDGTVWTRTSDGWLKRQVDLFQVVFRAGSPSAWAGFDDETRSWAELAPEVAE